MSEQPRRAQRRLDIDRLYAFLEERGSANECPICKSTDWLIDDRMPGIGLTIPKGNGNGSHYLGCDGASVIAMTCSRCAFLRLLDLRVCGEHVLTPEGGDE